MAATIDGKTRAPDSPPEAERPPPPPANLAALRPPTPPARTRAPTRVEATSPTTPPVRAKARARPRPARPRPARPRPPAPPRGTQAVPAAPSAPSPPDGRFDLNEAEFEELRGAGLSITQAKRLIAQREQRQGFRSLADLDSVPGFPRDVIAELKRRFRV